MKEPPPGMVEKRGAGLWLTHMIMIIGVVIVFFPIWLAFVASTVTQPEIVSPPMPLWPGDQFFNNYKEALFSGVNVPVATMLLNSLIMAIGIAVGKIIISLFSLSFLCSLLSAAPVPRRVHYSYYYFFTHHTTLTILMAGLLFVVLYTKETHHYGVHVVNDFHY